MTTSPPSPRRLDLVAAGTGTPAAVDALHAHLRGRSRWLLVFDNAEDPDDLTPWLPDGPGHLIITSRSPAWTGVAQPVDVDVFTRAESVALLHTHLPHLADADADRLADALGDLPLAIGQAAGLLAETRIGVGTYLAELEHARRATCCATAGPRRISGAAGRRRHPGRRPAGRRRPGRRTVAHAVRAPRPGADPG